MKYVGLGRSGLKVSRVALGMMTFGTTEWRPWILDEDAARPIVQRAIELGINIFDTADMYSGGVLSRSRDGCFGSSRRATKSSSQRSFITRSISHSRAVTHRRRSPLSGPT